MKNNENDSFLEFILKNYLENYKKYWFLFPINFLIWVWYQSLYGKNLWIRFLCGFLDSVFIILFLLFFELIING